MSGTSSERFLDAKGRMKRGQWNEAAELLLELMSSSHVVATDYVEWCRAFARVERERGHKIAAAYCLLYLGELSASSALFDEAGRSFESAHAQQERDAIGAYERAGRIVHAAVAAARARDAKAEIRLWQRVLLSPRLLAEGYEDALVHFNLGLAARRLGDEDAGRRYAALAQRKLECVADAFETAGAREQAFSCYAILLQLGQELSTFENVAEGYLNCVRVLKADNLKFYALQYYEDFVRISIERAEFHAAATACLEVASYARASGLHYDRGYQKRAAEMWWRAAEKILTDGGATELAENAYLAAVDAYNALGDYTKVKETYLRLADSAATDKQRARYREVAGRYSDALPKPPEPPSFPDYLRSAHAYPEIWYLDLIEWEIDGDWSAVCLDLIADDRQPDMIRRRALVLLLTESQSDPKDPASLARLARGLGELQTYAVLRPLEVLAKHESLNVRQSVMQACGNLYFKRTFQMLERALADAPSVKKAALEAVGRLHVPHAFDPLTRIFRQHEDDEIRRVALSSIGRMGTLEAGEFLLQVLRHEARPLAELAAQKLGQFDNAEVRALVDRHLELEQGEALVALKQVQASLKLRA